MKETKLIGDEEFEEARKDINNIKIFLMYMNMI